LVSLVEDATGATLAELTSAATLGELLTPLAAGPSAVWDRASAPEIMLYSGHIASADEEPVLAGANRLLVETDDGAWELIGFAAAELIGTARYRLTGLLRGLGGTEHAIGLASSGNRVMVHDNRTLSLPLSDDRIGNEITATAFAGVTDALGAPVVLSTALAPLLPLAPVHLRVRRDAGSGDILFDWIRCSRSDSGNWAMAEVPLSLTPEAYELAVFDGANLVRTFACTAPAVTYSAGEQVADFGGPASSFDFTVAQMSAVAGPGHAAEGSFNG
jgi:hypothetical protein